MNGRQRILSACTGAPVDRPPVWMMRQAGRYLPEYRALKERYSFWDMVRTPEVAVEATLQPLRRYPVDASILFSDILTVLDAMGAQVRYEEGGPRIGRPFQGEDDCARLRDTDMRQALSYVGDAMALLCSHVHPDRAVYGFAGAPLTLAAYLVEGGSSRDLRGTKALFYRSPDLARDLLFALADAVADLLALQVDAGADAVQVFDTWAGLLSPQDYESFALPATRRVLERLGKRVPVVLYLRGAASHLETAARSGCDMISVDSSVRLEDARRRLDPSIGLQGNLDPAELLGPLDRIRARTREMMAAAGPHRYVVNLGQGLTPDIPPQAVDAFVDAVVTP